MAESQSSAATKYLAVLHDIADSNSLINYEIKFDSNGSSVDGFIGDITEVQIVSKNKDLNLVIKSCEVNDKVRAGLPIESIIKREIFMYQTVFPLFRNFEIENGIEPLEFAPKYYNSFNNNDCNALVLNNLKKIGYSVYNRKGLLDDKHVSLVIERYAKFHAVSLAYKDQHPLKFKALVDSMEDFTPQIFTDPEFMELITKQMKKTGSSLDSELHRDAKIVYEKYIPESVTFLSELSLMVDEFSVIIHGDCWKNNMMFKYGDNSDPTSPTDVRLIDFQMSRHASPMIDIANFVYGSSSKEVIDNVHKYLEIYYDSLSHHLQNFGKDAGKLYPFSVMMEHWKKFARFGVHLRAMLLAITFSEDKDHKRYSDVLELGGNASTMFDYEISDIEKYNDLSRHAITHFVENHYI